MTGVKIEGGSIIALASVVTKVGESFSIYKGALVNKIADLFT